MQYVDEGYVFLYLSNTDLSTGETSSFDAGMDYLYLAATETAQAADGTVYGVFYSADGNSLEWGTVDYETCQRTTIGPASQAFVAIGITKAGQIYAIGMDGKLYKVNKSTGEETLVGATGLTLTNLMGQYGHVKIKIEPNEPGKGYEFVNAIVGGAIPKEYIPAIDNGIQGAMKSGVLAGYPVVDVKVTLWDGSYHEVDSSEMAFSIAGSMAFKDAMRKADPIITEPIMKVAVIVPDEYLGDVIGDLNARRGQIQGMEAMAGTQRVNAFVPLAQMFGYATDLRSKTQGRGQYVMEPSHYEPVPKNIADQIIAGRTKG